MRLVWLLSCSLHFTGYALFNPPPPPPCHSAAHVVYMWRPNWLIKLLISSICRWNPTTFVQTLSVGPTVRMRILYAALSETQPDSADSAPTPIAISYAILRIRFCIWLSCRRIERREALSNDVLIMHTIMNYRARLSQSAHLRAQSRAAGALITHRCVGQASEFTN